MYVYYSVDIQTHNIKDYRNALTFNCTQEKLKAGMKYGNSVNKMWT